MSQSIEDGKVKFFWINKSYNTYLHSLDNKISPSVKENGNERPSISVGIKLNGHNYIIPITSQYNNKWSNQVTFKVKDEDDNNKVIACLKINNMHPVLESEITYIDFEQQSENYKRLLYKEYDYIKKNIETVIKKVNQTYNKVAVKKDQFFTDLCVDFLNLESNYADYGKVAPAKPA